jgi:hypothetical protein
VVESQGDSGTTVGSIGKNCNAVSECNGIAVSSCVKIWGKELGVHVIE